MSSRKRTSGGVELTDERIAELAREAEAGYPLGQLRPRSRRGRPSLGKEAATVVHVRLPPELRGALEAAAEAEGTTPSTVIRQALTHFLAERSPSTAATKGNGDEHRARNRRDVTPSTRGSWVVRDPAARRASGRFATQKEALDAGRRILRNRGGGELRVAGRDGRFRRTITVEAG